MNRARTMPVALAAAGILSATAACSSAARTPASTSAATGTAAATLPGTPPGAQARWLLGAIAHQPIPAAAITAHFDQVFLTKIPAAQLNAVLARVSTLRPDAVLTSTSEFVTLAVSLNGQPETVSVSVDAHGLINGLGLAAAAPQPALTVPTTWAAVDRQIQQAAPQTRLLVARVSGGALPDRPRRGRHDPGPARLGLQALRARRAGAGHRRGHGQLGPAAHPHQPADEPAVRRTGDRTRRHPGDGAAGSPGHDLEQRQHRRRPAHHAGRPDGGRVGRGRPRAWRTPPWTRRSSPPGSCSS